MKSTALIQLIPPDCGSRFHGTQPVCHGHTCRVEREPADIRSKRRVGAGCRGNFDDSESRAELCCAVALKRNAHMHARVVFFVRVEPHKPLLQFTTSPVHADRIRASATVKHCVCVCARACE